MASFGSAIYSLLKELGMFDLIIPLILIWAVSYAFLKASLSKIEPIKDNAGPLASLIGFGIAFMVIYFSAAIHVLRTYIAVITVFFIFIFIGVAFAGFFGTSEKEFTFANLIKNNAFKAVFFLSMIILFFVSLALNPYISESTSATNATTGILGFGYVVHPAVWGSVLFFVIVTVVMWSLSS